MEVDESLQCPVCRARFRGSTACSRCGADLERLMLLTVRSYELRQEAAESLLTGDYERARALASEAQESRLTRRGADLERLSAWLMTLEEDGESANRAAAAEDLTHDQDASERTNGAPRRREGRAVICCLLLAGIAGLAWSATAEAARWRKNTNE